MPIFRIFMFFIVLVVNFYVRRNRNTDTINVYDTDRIQKSFTNFLGAKVRRFFAIRKARKYITKYNRTYSLKNHNLTLIYDDKKLEITCIEKIDNKRKTVISKDNYKYEIYHDSEENFRREFDNICSFFSQNTTFEDIYNIMDWNYYLSEPTFSAKKKANAPQKNYLYIDEYLDYKTGNFADNYNKQYFKPEEKIDINSADEEEIVKLPGINIILAKKIIDYRNLNNGFKSQEEFYRTMNIKPHFKKQLEHLIIIGDFKWEKEITLDKERTIDF